MHAHEKVASSIGRNAAISSIAVFGSRILGLLREQLFAFCFGASREYDAFLTAFRIPNLCRDLLAEGALSSAFVSVFSKDLQQEGKARAYRTANLVTNSLGLLLLVIVALGIWAAPNIVGLIAIGFDADKAALATDLTRIMFPYLFFVALAACAMGMLNAQGYYALPQSASSFFNIVSIVAGFCIAYALAPDYIASLWHVSSQVNHQGAAKAMTGMAIGVLCGGVVQWCIQWPTLRRTGYRFAPIFDLHDASFKQVLRLMGPAVIGAAAVQINVFVNSNFASILGDKPISWLNYAFRLMQFPIGVFGVAVMTASLPTMAKHLANNNHQAFGKTITEAMELVFLLTLPATCGLSILAEPIIRLMYQHGRFSAADTFATAEALHAYAIGLPCYASIKIMQPAYVAMNQAKTPMVISLAAVVMNIICNYILIHMMHIGHVGLAYSTSLMAIFNMLMLCIILQKRAHVFAYSIIAKQCVLITFASACMGMMLFFGYHMLQQHGFAQGSTKAAIELFILIPTGVCVYVGIAHYTGVKTVRMVTATIRAKFFP